tara:strand:- start:530 stop:1141 length:612 start_codon:yes stop_codon:yes gene_type:complete
VVYDAISIAVLTVGHFVFEIHPCSTACGNVFAVNLALFCFGKRDICLKQGVLEFLRFHVNGQLLHDTSGLPEGIRPDDKNSSFAPLSFDGVPPLRIGLFFRKVRMEFPYDLLVAHQASKFRPKGLAIMVSRDHKDQESLVTRGYIQSLSETVKILQDRALVGPSGAEFLGNLLHCLDDAVTLTASSWSPSLAQTLGGAAPRSR